MGREPLVVINASIILIETFIALFISFGVFQLSTEQVGSIMAFVNAIAGVINAVWGRSQVTPVASPRDNHGNPLGPI